MENQKSALGLDGNVTALIGYLIGIVALVLIFIEKDNKFVRFHALQSVMWAVLFFVAIFAFVIIAMILGFIAGMVSEGLAWGVGGLAILIYIGLFIGFFGGLIFAAIKAFGGNEFKLPIVGNMVQKWV